MTECPFCQRPSFLWSGDTCDVCDKDSDGTNDRDESIGIGPVEGHSLFRAEDKGFEVVDAGHLQISLGEWPVYPTQRQWNLYQRVLKIIERRYNVVGYGQ